MIKLSKHEHFANLTPCAQSLIDDIKNGSYLRKIYDINREDLSHLIPHVNNDITDEEQSDFLHQVSIDPDNILPQYWKQRFFEVCKRFTAVITPKPGKYNGYYGRIDNSINFATTPPPSIRAHLPKYNNEMLTIMAEKMNKLEEWGVLRKPEEIGVVPEFVLPSMLTPKSESGEWRLVTDFTALNIHIKKLRREMSNLQICKQTRVRWRQGSKDYCSRRRKRSSAHAVYPEISVA